MRKREGGKEWREDEVMKSRGRRGGGNEGKEGEMKGEEKEEREGGGKERI
jgi:hypothetical protein